MNKYIHFFLSVTLALLVGLPGAWAQDAGQTVRGRVLDARSKVPLEGIKVTVPGTQAEGTTNAEGVYEIKVPAKSPALEFVFADYQTKRVHVYGRETVDVSLFRIGESVLGEQVHTLDGDKPLRGFANAVAVISGKDIVKQGYITLDQAIQGMVPGVMVRSRSGHPGAGGDMSIRGFASISGNSSPLIIVDGYIYETRFGDDSPIDGYRSNPLGGINPRDVESVTVIKDGTAGYGAMGANGVIMIETLRPDLSKTSVNVGLSTGTVFKPESMPVLDASQYKNYGLEQLQSQGLTYAEIMEKYPFMVDQAVLAEKHRYSHDTDWQDEVLQGGMFNNFNISVEGGDNVATYALAAGYTSKDGVIKNTDYDRYDLRFNADLKLLQKLTVRPRINFAYTNNTMRDQGVNSTVNPFTAAMAKSPITGPFKMSDFGVALPHYDPVDAFGFSNPRSLVDNVKISDDNYRMFIGMDATYAITDAFRVVVSGNIDFMKGRINRFIPKTGVVPQVSGEALNSMDALVRRYLSYYGEGRLDYSKLLAKRHSVRLVTGVRVKTSEFENDLGRDMNSASDEFTTVGRSEKFETRSVSGGELLNNWASYFARGNYAYLDKYYLSASVSVDGSSRFGQNNRVGVFHAVSGAWRVSSESFLNKIRNLDDAKLRVSYSLTGNDDIDPNASRYLYVASPYSDISGLVRGNVFNPNLQWESHKQINFGGDISLFGERVRVSADYFESEITDMVNYALLPVVYGQTFYASNGGAMENKGWEIGLNVRAYDRGETSVDFGFNIAKYENKVTSLADNKATQISETGVLGKEPYQLLDINGGQVLTQVGRPVNSFYGFQTAGVYTTSEQAAADGFKNFKKESFRGGDIRFVDQNGDKIIDDRDKTAIGSPLPDMFGSFLTNFRHKRISVRMLWDFAYGHDVFNYTRMKMESMSGMGNQSEAVANRWRREGQQTDIPRLAYGDPMGNAAFSDRWIEDGSFARLRDLTVSYDFRLPNKKIFQSVNVFASGQNLLTLTDYLGATPDVSPSGNVMRLGADYGGVPFSASLIFGVNIGL
ncbi:SusC/RagA family TonB-linked outer membrane protein (plasmid) [Fulvitalea axinellae]|uniref:SusC/RagA family TonB-linked outer membrane protein n=1 Tax=Fulvitalea axinellae TaxID=1182444 RepID=A0AAU9CNU5_9BACT|nr:SusC/RagA family TonB-linked outer membrane protein [Fulvitalea axinellae]